MPNGYTCDIYDGDLDFQKFALKCASNFAHDFDVVVAGSTRDYEQEIAYTEMNMAETEAWSSDRARQEADDFNSRMMGHWTAKVERANMLRLRYETMQAKVQSWNPPTPDHESLKAFMIEQLQCSIEHDCHINPSNKPETITADAYKELCVESFREHAERLRKAWRNEAQDIVRHRNWLKELKDSILD